MWSSSDQYSAQLEKGLSAPREFLAQPLEPFLEILIPIGLDLYGLRKLPIKGSGKTNKTRRPLFKLTMFKCKNPKVSAHRRDIRQPLNLGRFELPITERPHYNLVISNKSQRQGPR
jgi:hypothetical protein